MNRYRTRDITRAVNALRDGGHERDVHMIAAGLFATGWRLEPTATTQPHMPDAVNFRVWRDGVCVRHDRWFRLREWLLTAWVPLHAGDV